MSALARRTLIAAGAAALAMPLFARPAAVAGLRVDPDREEMIAVPGGRVYVRVNGDLRAKRAPIVLAHGGPGSSHWYLLAATALADERAVILYDQLDSNRSDAPGDPANWTVPRFVAELEAIRARLGIDRWHVFGTSWGATFALDYAAAHRDRLASLILSSPLISTPVWLADARRLKDAMPEPTRTLLDRCDTPGAAPEADCQAATDAFYARHVRRYAPLPEVAAYRDAQPRAFSPAIYTHMWGRAEFTATGTLKDHDGTPLLARLDGGRTLFVAGEYDEAVPATVAAFAARVPGATFAEIPDAAHSIMSDNPAGYLDLLRPWLGRHDA
jgi:L-proline amide hydrolase